MLKYSDVAGNIDIDSSSWAKRIFKRMSFVRYMKTSSKVTIPGGARKKLEYFFRHEIVAMIEKYKILHSMRINIDETPLKYVSVENFTLVQKGSTAVIVGGVNDKRCIAGTFGISFKGNFLPIKLIYAGKLYRICHFRIQFQCNRYTLLKFRWIYQVNSRTCCIILKKRKRAWKPIAN